MKSKSWTLLQLRFSIAGFSSSSMLSFMQQSVFLIEICHSQASLLSATTPQKVEGLAPLLGPAKSSGDLRVQFLTRRLPEMHDWQRFSRHYCTIWGCSAKIWHTRQYEIHCNCITHWHHNRSVVTNLPRVSAFQVWVVLSRVIAYVETVRFCVHYILVWRQWCFHNSEVPKEGGGS